MLCIKRHTYPVKKSNHWKYISHTENKALSRAKEWLESFPFYTHLRVYEAVLALALAPHYAMGNLCYNWRSFVQVICLLIFLLSILESLEMGLWNVLAVSFLHLEFIITCEMVSF